MLTDSSLETQYSSPLLNCSKQFPAAAAAAAGGRDWTGFLGPPAAAGLSPHRGGGHYAATDIVRTGPRHHHHHHQHQHVPARQKNLQQDLQGGLYIV